MVKQVITRSSVSPRIDENVEEHLDNHLDKHIKMTYLIMKRILDIIFSLLALVLLCPVFFLIICCIKIDSKGSVFFKQKRIGKNKKEFYILKFRTMKIETPQYIPTDKLNKSNNYITRVGHFLRKSSLDELPQFINILRGDMTLIGPRPALYNQYDLINERDKYHVNELKPGLTGWAQVNGRNLLSWEDKFEKDVYYVRNISFLFDLKIVLKTIAVVFRHNDINSATNATMEAFTGTKPKQ